MIRNNRYASYLLLYISILCFSLSLGLMSGHAQKKKAAAIQPDPMPPPRTGKVINRVFPSSDTDPVVTSANTEPLEVVRASPEGNVDIAYYIIITFSQPMVRITAIDDIAGIEVPVKLLPQPEGEWHWIGTNTLLFEPKAGRFNGSTEYSIEIPSGIKSVIGGSLSNSKSWTFTTPPLEMKSGFPNLNNTRSNPIIFIEFNQHINKEEAVKHIRLKSNEKEWSLRLATDSEVSSVFDDYRYDIDKYKNADKESVINLRVAGASEDKNEPILPLATTYTVLINKSITSSEGPISLNKDQYFNFRTSDVPLLDSASMNINVEIDVTGRGGQTDNDGNSPGNLPGQTKTVRLPLMVKSSAPRFLNYRDKFELPVIVQNQTEKAMRVDVKVQGENVISPNTNKSTCKYALNKVRQKSITTCNTKIDIQANNRVEIRFPMYTVAPGQARFNISAVSTKRGEGGDAAEISIPVYTPATTEAFATYGEIDEGAIIQPVKSPSGVIKEFGGLDITTSSTQYQSLTDAVIYLTNYPFECAEHVSSRIMAIALLRDVLTAFNSKDRPKPEELIESVSKDIKRLQSLQNTNGGFSFWTRNGDDENEWPYLGIYAAHALHTANLKGFDVPAEMLTLSQKYLEGIDNHIPHWYSNDLRQTLIAYSFYVRSLMNDKDTDAAKLFIKMEEGGEKLPIESLGWLLAVLSGDAESMSDVAEIRRILNNRVAETASIAHFATSYSDKSYLLLHSDSRTDAVLLNALIINEPKSELIPKLARGLLNKRKQGRWLNTQENAFVLLALVRYFQTYESVTPDFVAKVWLGEKFAGNLDFKGSSIDSKEINVPMELLMKNTGAQNLPIAQNLIVSKEGGGRLYYRIGMRYAPESMQLKPSYNGFSVTRSYEAIDNPNDVRRDEDGMWRIKAGARVCVRLTMAANSQRYHVALSDPMPAGFEALNAALAVTEPIPQDPEEQKDRDRSLGWMNWFEHQNIRDDRVEAFASLLWEGVYKYSYVARATTPGVFTVPPAKAEEMYNPETFGRSSSNLVIIE